MEHPKHLLAVVLAVVIWVFVHLEVETVDLLHPIPQMNLLVVVNLVLLVVMVVVVVVEGKEQILLSHQRVVAVVYFGFVIPLNIVLFQLHQVFHRMWIMEHTKFINGMVQEVGRGQHLVLIQHHK
jgi:hypothetical protein